jgi:hypothetical protein
MPRTPRESGPVEVPRSVAETPPPSYPHAVEMGYIVESLMEIQKSLGELKAHVEQTNSRLNTQERNSRTDFWRTLSGLAAATVVLMGALIFGYFKLDERIATTSTGLTKVETKVDILLQHTPGIPAPTVLPQR